MTVFTIVYNNYGVFIPQFNECLDKQTVKVKKLIILGKNHGADIDYLQANNIEYVEIDSDSLPVLINKGLELVNTEWHLFWTIDDELLPNACEEIMKVDADVVALKFYVGEDIVTSAIMQSEEEIQNYMNLFYYEGWVANRNNKIYYREDLEIPLWVNRFDLFRAGLKQEVLEIPVARHIVRAESQGNTNARTGEWKIYFEQNKKYI